MEVQHEHDKNRPSTPIEESAEAIVLEADRLTTSSESGAMVLPTVNQLISEEVACVLGTRKQSEYCPETVEIFLLNLINKRLVRENKASGLKGALAHRPLKFLPPSVIATCIANRELRFAGLIGESETTAELVTYEDMGPDEGLYVPAEQRIRRLARSRIPLHDLLQGSERRRGARARLGTASCPEQGWGCRRAHQRAVRP